MVGVACDGGVVSLRQDRESACCFAATFPRSTKRRLARAVDRAAVLFSSLFGSRGRAVYVVNVRQ